MRMEKVVCALNWSRIGSEWRMSLAIVVVVVVVCPLN